jgi:hypothetical protein
VSGRRCLDDAQLAAAVDGTADADEETHLKTCERCRYCYELLVKLIQLGGDSVEAAAEALTVVEKRARECVSRLEGTVAPHRWPLTASREMASPSIVSAMLDRFEALMDIAAPDALSMADAALAVAGLTAALLDDGGASLRCRAWKAKAVALASFAYYDDAAAALDEAANTARDLGDVAAIAYARAWLFGNPDVWRPAEALAILDAHLGVFEQLSATKHYAAFLMRAAILLRMGDISSAERDLAELGQKAVGSLERAMVQGNLARCSLIKGDAECSLTLAREAAALYRSQGTAGRIPLLQAEWIIAQALGAIGQPEAGLLIARRVTDEFIAMHLDEHAVRAELTCIQLMLACDPGVDVRTSCDRVLRLASRWPGPRAACAAEALQYLRDMANERAATLDDAMTVDTYIDSLRTATPLRFRPPMPLIVVAGCAALRRPSTRRARGSRSLARALHSTCSGLTQPCGGLACETGSACRSRSRRGCSRPRPRA